MNSYVSSTNDSCSTSCQRSPRSTCLISVSCIPSDIVTYLPSAPWLACRGAHLEFGFPLSCVQRLSGTDIATERCPWQDNSYTIGPLTPVLSYWGQLLSTHLRAHWIETDFLLLGQLVSCSRWLPA